MAYVHDFGIIDSIEENKEYKYEPGKYNCISVDGDFIDEIYHKGFGAKMQKLETFAHNTQRPYKDLCYYGITLIPPTSLKAFRMILIEANLKYNSEEFMRLIGKVEEALNQEKWMIHYGV